MDIHNYERRLERTLDKIKNSSSISSQNKKHILKFYDTCFSEGISKCKIDRYLFDLHKLAEWIKIDFKKADRSDIQKLGQSFFLKKIL